MGMRKINVRNYSIVIPTDAGEKEVPFKVKDSIIELLFAPVLRLNGPRLLKQQDLAEKVKNATDDLLLEEEEYERVLNAFTLFEGFDRHSVELVRRVLEAPKVDVIQK